MTITFSPLALLPPPPPPLILLHERGSLIRAFGRLRAIERPINSVRLFAGKIYETTRIIPHNRTVRGQVIQF